MQSQERGTAAANREWRPEGKPTICELLPLWLHSEWLLQILCVFFQCPFDLATRFEAQLTETCDGTELVRTTDTEMDVLV